MPVDVIPGQTPTTEPGTTPTTPTTPEPAPDGARVFDAEYVRQLRAEAAENRKAAQAAAADLKKLQDAQLSDAEKQSARLNELETAQAAHEQERRDLRLRLEVEREARRMGIVDEDAAFRLLDTASIKFDDAGMPTGVDKALKALTEARAWLIQAPSAPPVPATSPTNPPRPGGTPLTRDDIRRMTPEQINANWDAVQAAMSAR